MNICVSTEIVDQSLEAQRQQMLAEFEAERTNHQRVLRDYDRLEQRYQNLQDELEIEKFSPMARREVDNLISASSSGLLQSIDFCHFSDWSWAIVLTIVR